MHRHDLVRHVGWFADRCVPIGAGRGGTALLRRKLRIGRTPQIRRYLNFFHQTTKENHGWTHIQVFENFLEGDIRLFQKRSTIKQTRLLPDISLEEDFIPVSFETEGHCQFDLRQTVAAGLVKNRLNRKLELVHTRILEPARTLTRERL